MEIESGNQTGPTGRAFDQQQIENVQEVTGCVSNLLVSVQTSLLFFLVEIHQIKFILMFKKLKTVLGLYLCFHLFSFCYLLAWGRFKHRLYCIKAYHMVHTIWPILYGPYSMSYVGTYYTISQTGEVFEMRDRKILKKLQDTIHGTQKVVDAKISQAQSGESIKKRLKSFFLLVLKEKFILQ